MFCGKSDESTDHGWIVACSDESALEMDLGAGSVLTWNGAVAWGLSETTRPTCPRCAVLLDEALEKGRT